MTVRSTTPATCAAVVAVIVVLLTTVTPVAAVPPTVTVAPFRKLLPEIMIAVPPLVEPDVGVTLDTAGGGPRYVNPLVSVADWVSGFVTVTFTIPAACAAVVALIVVLLTTVMPVAATPPIVTDAPAAKL